MSIRAEAIISAFDPSATPFCVIRDREDDAAKLAVDAEGLNSKRPGSG